MSSPLVVFGIDIKTIGSPYSLLSGSLSFSINLAVLEPDFVELLEPIDKGN